MLVDTHCHIHESTYPLDVEVVLRRAQEAGVEKLICVGTSEQSSHEAVEFATHRENVFASVGVHPHEVKEGWSEIKALLASSSLLSFSAPDELTAPAPSKQISSRLDSLREASLSAAELPAVKQSSPIQEASRKESGSLNNVSSGAGAVNSARAQQESSHSFTSFGKYLQPELNPTPGPDIEPGAKPFTKRGEGRGDQDGGKSTETPTTVNPKIVAIGEIGLDYFYMHSPRDIQIRALEAQIELALAHKLPIIFHVREAFDDFWPIFDNFQGIRGELHSFTDTAKNVEEGLKRGLYIGVNGISTFTKDTLQQQLFATIPLERLLLETDAPFLTPMPFRGRVNEPAFVTEVAAQHARMRAISFEDVATATTANAHALFAFR